MPWLSFGGSQNTAESYGHVNRYCIAAGYKTFDFPSPNRTAADRTQTLTPQQSLFLMNAPFVEQRAGHLMEERESSIGPDSDDHKRLRWLYCRILGRGPLPAEQHAAVRFLSDISQHSYSSSSSKKETWRQLAHALRYCFSCSDTLHPLAARCRLKKDDLSGVVIGDAVMPRQSRIIENQAYREALAASLEQAREYTQRKLAKNRKMINRAGEKIPNVTSLSFKDRVRKHALLRQHTLGELLIYGKVLREGGAVSGQTHVSHRGAYWQMTKGVRPDKTDLKWATDGTHAMHRLLLFDGALPNLRLSNLHYQHRIIAVFARTTLMPLIANKVDSMIEEIGGGYQADAVRSIFAGATPTEAYRGYARQMRECLEMYRERITTEARQLIGRGENMEDTLLTLLDSQVVQCLDVLGDQSEHIPQVLRTTRLEDLIQRENWFGSASSQAPRPEELERQIVGRLNADEL